MFPEVFRLQKPDIHTEAGQRQTRKTLRAWEAGMKEHRRRGRKEGLPAHHIKRLLEPMECFRYDLEWQIKTYERAKKGIIHPQTSLEYIGYPLIMARIARGWSRKVLAKKLEIPESGVIRYEQNDYHAVSIDTIRKIAVLLRVEFDIHVRLLKSGEESNDSYAMMFRRAASSLSTSPSRKRQFSR